MYRSDRMTFKKFMRVSLVSTVLFSCVFASSLYAAPNLINYRGTLTDNVGQPIDADVSIEFRLFDDGLAVTQPWGATQLD